MKCFNHNETDALGICKNCHKGICKDCVSEVHNGLACKGSCEDDVKLLNKLVEKSSDSYTNLANGHKRNAIIFLIMGAVFLYMAWTINSQDRIFYVLGGVMLFSSFTSFLNYNKTNNKKNNDQETLDFE